MTSDSDRKYTSPFRKKKMRLLIVLALILLIMAIGVWLYFFSTHQQADTKSVMTDKQYDSYTNAINLAKIAQSSTVPIEKVMSLAAAGDAMSRAGKYQQSFDYYQEAQRIVDASNELKEQGFDYSEQLGDQYRLLGDKSHAAAKYDAAIKWLKADSSRPQPTELIAEIEKKKTMIR